MVHSVWVSSTSYWLVSCQARADARGPSLRRPHHHSHVARRPRAERASQKGRPGRSWAGCLRQRSRSQLTCQRSSASS
eukprot:scaffold2348_cov341-Prasinococcus_capsulatus_cf.AAC.4